MTPSANDNGLQEAMQAVLDAHSDDPGIIALGQTQSHSVQNAAFDRNELTLTIAREDIIDVCRTLQCGGYNFMADITCVDWYPNQPRFQVTYHLLSLQFKRRLRLCVLVDSGDPSVDSITSVWPAANFYEREVFDLFGVRFGGHPNLRRLLLPEDFQGHPLRKDFPVEGYR